MDDEMNFFYFLAPLLGIVMRWLYLLVQNYGWTIIIFTFLVRILMFPLSLKQQKSQARMSAYQPMIQEIQKKWANDKNRQSQEMQKFYEENDLKMTAGCLPMVVNMIVIFGIIGVIQQPLNYIMQVSEADIAAGASIVAAYNEDSTILTNTYTQQSVLIGEVKADPDKFLTGTEVVVPATEETAEKTEHVSMSAESVEKIQSFNFRFMGLDMSAAPTADNWVTLIMPILSILTMFASQFIIMKTSGTAGQGKGQMLIMTIVMGAMFGYFAFTVPAGFSLYYTVSNVVMTLQQIVLRRIYDPEKIREEVEAEIEARRAEKKSKKKVVVQTEAGEVESLELSESELVKLRLAKAREMDALKYGMDDDDSASGENAGKLEKARKQDEEKFSKKALPEKSADNADNSTENNAENTLENADGETPAEEAAAADPEAQSAAAKAEYKPGRRKRAKQNKESDDPTSFAEEEQQAEQQDKQKEEE